MKGRLNLKGLDRLQKGPLELEGVGSASIMTSRLGGPFTIGDRDRVAGLCRDWPSNVNAGPEVQRSILTAHRFESAALIPLAR